MGSNLRVVEQGSVVAQMTPGFRKAFKGNPQQGTLFQASADELDPTGQRYRQIRGYTPDEQREAWDAVGEVGFSTMGEREGYDDAEFPMTYSGEEEFAAVDDASKRDWGEGRAVIRDAVARSTVPREVVNRVQFAVTPNISANAYYGPKDDAIYFGRKATEAQEHREGFGTGHPTPETQRLDQGQTIIHELGHAADPALEPLRGVRNNIRDTRGENPVEGYTEPEDLGRVEEFADDFAEEHFRHDPRAASRRANFDVATATYPGTEPNDIPPRHLAGYSKWRERGQRSAADLKPRHELAEQQGGRYPQTGGQTRAVEGLRQSAEKKSPRMFHGSRPNPDAV